MPAFASASVPVGPSAWSARPPRWAHRGLPLLADPGGPRPAWRAVLLLSAPLLLLVACAAPGPVSAAALGEALLAVCGWDLALLGAVARSRAELDPWWDAWTALADDVAHPAAAPACALSWWDAVGGEAGQLHVVALEDEGELVGVAAFGCAPGRMRDYRLLGSGFAHRPGPLVRPGHERALGEAIAASFAGVGTPPDRVTFEGIDARLEAVVEAARGAWPRGLGARRRRLLEMTAPVVSLEGRTYETWFASRGRNFRKAALRAGRDAEAAGVRVRTTATAEELEADLATLRRLHDARWDDRGGSTISRAGSSWAVYEAIARALLPEGRLRLLVMEAGGQPIGADLSIVGAREMSSLTSGFDGEWAKMQPGNQLTSRALADAFSLGVDHLDLGGGAAWYKLRFADADRDLLWELVIPRGPRWPRTRLLMAPYDLRLWVRRQLGRLPETRLAQVKRTVATLRDMRMRSVARAEYNAAGAEHDERPPAGGAPAGQELPEK